jgi:hypothetical protein
MALIKLHQRDFASALQLFHKALEQFDKTNTDGDELMKLLKHMIITAVRQSEWTTAESCARCVCV